MKFGDISLAIDASLLGAGAAPSPKRPARPKASPPVDNGPPPNPNQGGGNKQGHGGQGSSGRGRGQAAGGRGRGQGKAASGLNAGLLEMMVLTRYEATTVNGGTLSDTSWRTVSFDTVDYNGITGASMGTDTFTLPAGTYEIEFGQVIMGTHQAQVRLWNDTTAALLQYGVQDVPENTTSGNYVEGFWTGTIAGDTVFSVDCIANISESTWGYGIAVADGANELYAQITIKRVDPADAGAEEMAHFTQVEANGTGGGSTSAGTWAIRSLNTSVYNTITGCTLSEPAITLPAGTYFCHSVGSVYAGAKGWTRLWDIGNSVELARGVGFFLVDRGEHTMFRGEFTLAAETTVRIEVYDSASSGTVGMGDPHDEHSGSEKYCDLMIWKQA